MRLLKSVSIRLALRGMRSGLAGSAAACIVVPLACAEPSEIELADTFDTAPLDPKRWSTYRVPQKRHWIDRHTVFSGKGALAIRVKGNDIGADCQCQQNEIREASKRRLKFGQEAWYSFRLRIRGTWPPTGGQRWVIGGWKQETDGSAFLAQRFDRGVFHITVESGNTRVLLASSTRKATGFLEVLKKGLFEGFEFVGDTERYSGEHDLQIAYGPDPILPDPAKDWVKMDYRVKGGLKGDGIVEVYADDRLIVSAKGTIGVSPSAGPTQYFKIGHNRDLMPGTATLFLDEFSRTEERATNRQ